jgi:hypothetical protein
MDQCPRVYSSKSVLPHDVENESVGQDEGVKRQPDVTKRDVVSLWNVNGLIRLKVCAKIIFSVPVSSIGIERLFSEAGMLLTNNEREFCQI